RGREATVAAENRPACSRRGAAERGHEWIRRPRVRARGLRPPLHLTELVAASVPGDRQEPLGLAAIVDDQAGCTLSPQEPTLDPPKQTARQGPSIRRLGGLCLL